MRALLAFDKFKDALGARDACAIAAAALHSVQPSWDLDLCPLTDGGEGFADILTAAAQGEIVTVEITGPRGRPQRAGFGLVPLKNIPPAALRRLDLPHSLHPNSQIALIEMAAASGLDLLSTGERDPWQTSTFGTGELMRAAAALKAAAIVLGIGGSATNDLGLGALAALGLTFSSIDAQPISPPTPAHWDAIAQIGGGLPADFPPVRVACDVTNPLLGVNGCTAVYGPQKGLRLEDVTKMEESVARMARLLCTHFQQGDALVDQPGAGAAGGIALGLVTAAGARLVSGFSLTTDWLDLTARIHSADMVLTGEGRYDASSTHGKGPGAIVSQAAAAGRAAHVFAGQINAAAQPGATFHAITPKDFPVEKALAATPALLRTAIERHFR